MRKVRPTYLMLAGWGGAGPEHWQTRWPQLHGHAARFIAVEQAHWRWPKRGDWMARLDEVLQSDLLSGDRPSGEDTGPGRTVVLVAHSLGCHLVAAWAAHSQHTDRVKAAWLVAPPDLDGEGGAGTLPQLRSWRAVVRQRLPFPATLLASRTDPHADMARSRELAADWGAHLEDLGDAGHVNIESGHGDWPEGWARLRQI